MLKGRIDRLWLFLECLQFLCGYSGHRADGALQGGWPQTTHMQMDWSSRSVALLNNKQTSGRRNVYPGARDRDFEAQVWDYQASDWASQARHLGKPRLGTVTLVIGYIFLCQFSQSQIMQAWPPIKGSWTKELSILSMLPQQKFLATRAKVNKKSGMW